MTSRRLKSNPQTAAEWEALHRWAARQRLADPQFVLPRVLFTRRYAPGSEDEAGLICRLTTERRSRTLDPADTLWWKWSELRAELRPEHFRIVDTLYRELWHVFGLEGWAADVMESARADLESYGKKVAGSRARAKSPSRRAPVKQRIIAQVARRRGKSLDAEAIAQIAETVGCSERYVREVVKSTP